MFSGIRVRDVLLDRLVETIGREVKRGVMGVKVGFDRADHGGHDADAEGLELEAEGFRGGSQGGFGSAVDACG